MEVSTGLVTGAANLGARVLQDSGDAGLPATMPVSARDVGPLHKIVLSARQRGATAAIIKQEIGRQAEIMTQHLRGSAKIDMWDQHFALVTRLLDSIERFERGANPDRVEYLSRKLDDAIVDLERLTTQHVRAV